MNIFKLKESAPFDFRSHGTMGFNTSTDFFLVTKERALQIMPKLGNKF